MNQYDFSQFFRLLGVVDFSPVHDTEINNSKESEGIIVFTMSQSLTSLMADLSVKTYKQSFFI